MASETLSALIINDNSYIFCHHHHRSDPQTIRPLWLLLEMERPQESEPVWLFWAEQGSKGLHQDTTTCQQALPPGLSVRWSPGNLFWVRLRLTQDNLLRAVQYIGSLTNKNPFSMRRSAVVVMLYWFVVVKRELSVSTFLPSAMAMKCVYQQIQSAAINLSKSNI